MKRTAALLAAVATAGALTATTVTATPAAASPTKPGRGLSAVMRPWEPWTVWCGCTSPSHFSKPSRKRAPSIGP